MTCKAVLGDAGQICLFFSFYYLNADLRGNFRDKGESQQPFSSQPPLALNLDILGCRDNVDYRHSVINEQLIDY